jgi:UDP-glucose:(heptosyl)LPS alpha-1,3-glucosyltransferase
MDDVNNIAVVRSSYSPYGGLETRTAELVKRILATGTKLSLLTLPHQKWPFSHPNLVIIPLGSLIKNRLWQLWSFERSVCNYLSAHSFKAVFSLDRVSCFTHFSAGEGSHKTFLLVKNSSSNTAARLFRKISLFHAYTLYIEKKGFHNPKLKKIHCCSNMVAGDIGNDYLVDSNKFQVIYNGINWREISNAFNNRAVIGNELLKAHGLDPSNNLLLFLGSGFARKGLDIAIKGLIFLPESYHLIVVGKDSCRAYMRQAEKLGLKKRVHFLGPQAQGWRYASICKAMVLPSRYEPFGLAAAEAQAMGIPVLVSENTGYAELISPGRNGIILKNHEDIKQAFTDLQYLIEDPSMSPSQIREAISHLDNDIIMGKIIRDFLEI